MVKLGSSRNMRKRVVESAIKTHPNTPLSRVLWDTDGHDGSISCTFDGVRISNRNPPLSGIFYDFRPEKDLICC